MGDFNDCSTMVDMNDASQPRRHTRVAGNDAMQIVLNCYQPGQRDEFHYHKGSTRTYLIFDGSMTIRIRNDEGITDYTVAKGGCALIPEGEYYQFYNHTDAPALIYQVSQRAGRGELMIWGKGEVLPQDYFTDEWVHNPDVAEPD